MFDTIAPNSTQKSLDFLKTSLPVLIKNDFYLYNVSYSKLSSINIKPMFKPLAVNLLTDMSEFFYLYNTSNIKTTRFDNFSHMCYFTEDLGNITDEVFVENLVADCGVLSASCTDFLFSSNFNWWSDL
jgi:hypothetical protein